jgi:hypothetical protein
VPIEQSTTAGSAYSQSARRSDDGALSDNRWETPLLETGLTRSTMAGPVYETHYVHNA